MCLFDWWLIDSLFGWWLVGYLFVRLLFSLWLVFGWCWVGRWWVAFLVGGLFVVCLVVCLVGVWLVGY